MVHSALLLVTLIYGVNYTVAKVVMPDYLQPFGFILLRITITTILFWTFSILTKVREKVAGRDIRRLMLCGLFGVASNQLLFFKGLSMTVPINASVIMTTSPIMVIIVAYLLGKESITLKKILGVVVGGIGAFLLLTKETMSLDEGTFLGDLLVLLNGTSYAIYLVIVKPLMVKYKAITVIKWVFLFGGLIAIPFGLGQLSVVHWTGIPEQVWLSIGFVIVGATFTAYLLNVWALKFVNSSVVGIYMYLQPVFATLVAISFRGDQLDYRTVLYSFIIMMGVYLVSKK